MAYIATANAQMFRAILKPRKHDPVTSVMTALEYFHFLPIVVLPANRAFHRYSSEFDLHVGTIPQHRPRPLLATPFTSH